MQFPDNCTAHRAREVSGGGAEYSIVVLQAGRVVSLSCHWAPAYLSAYSAAFRVPQLEPRVAVRNQQLKIKSNRSLLPKLEQLAGPAEAY